MKHSVYENNEQDSGKEKKERVGDLGRILRQGLSRRLTFSEFIGSHPRAAQTLPPYRPGLLLHCCLSTGLCIREAGGLACREEVSELPWGGSRKPGLSSSAWMLGQAVCALRTLSIKYWTCLLTGFCRLNELM